MLRTLSPPGAWGASLVLPALLGALLAVGVAADALLARSLSLKWAAPWLRGAAPPLLSLLVAGALLLLVLAATLWRQHLPGRSQAAIVLLFSATQLVGFNLANIEPLKIALLLVSAGWLADALLNNRPLRLYPPLLMVWLLILAFGLLSILNGRVISLVAQYSLIAKFLMFFIVANLVRTPQQLLFALRLLVMLGLGSALLALAQEGLFYFLGVPLTLEDNAPKYWFKDTPLGWMIRATAFHPTAQNLSHALLMSLALLLLGPFSVRQRIGGGLLLALGIFFTFSGNALMVTVALLLLAPLMAWPRRALHYLAALALLALLLYLSGVAGWAYDKYLLPISGKSAEDRIALLQLGLEMMARHPWTGIGLNNFGSVSPQPVHNAYLQMVTEIGIVPGLLLCLMLLLVALRLLLGTVQTPAGPLRQAGLGMLLALTGLLVHFQFEPFINSLVSWSIIGLAEATALLLYRSRTDRLAPTAART